jgi:glycosyltransferase involved in cell wall biosynthesis
MDKISIITVVKDGVPFIKDSINSFLLQKYQNKELIIILATNSDTTKNFIKKNYSYNKKIKIFYESDKTKNKFGALNQGIRLASGEIIGILHSDDIYYSENVLTEVASKFSKYPITLLYSDIIISNRNNLTNINRIWTDASYDLKKDIQKGWMPPHTSIFVRKRIYKKNIFYSTKYSISGDYSWIIKLINYKKTKTLYINKPLIIMRSGGDSSINFFKKLSEDLKILKFYKYPYKIINFKYLRKINQFVINRKNVFVSNYIKKIIEKKIIYIINFRQILKKKQFILSAFNLATFTYLKNSINENNFYYWFDGIFAKFIFKKIKITPGRIMFKNIYNYCQANKISSLTAGTYTKKTAVFINNYKCASFCDVSNLDFNNTFLKIKKNIKKKFSLLILVLPTPMQEKIAIRLASYKNNLKIICIGGTFRMFTGEEKTPPFIYSKYNLTSLWRLHTDPLRRIYRAIVSLQQFILFVRNIYNLQNIKLHLLTK